MTNRPPHPRRNASVALRWIRRLSGILLPVAALLVVVTVLKGAGVPLTVPGVLIAIGLLFVVRLAMGWSRRGRRDHPVTPRRRSR
ncbi:hypothetical protein [Microbacterium hydrothermale]|uniref:hypothetical protein n=1 Tax=Microbacterium hydrothermale TaxID=857427 RepID=UPI0010A79676|nr:hypothetical protein [Microbacterium hydrothermale]